MRPGVRLAVDPGGVRVGVAVSDPDGSLASPLVTLRRRADAGDLDELAGMVSARGAVEVVVGLPLSLSGQEGHAAAGARAYAGELARRVHPVPVRLVDERLTTVTAGRHLRGRRGARRDVIDQAAAVTLLQQALDAERGTGVAPGELVAPA